MSSTSALLSLSSVGRQDSSLTSSPEISFFQKAIRRYTNFAVASMEQTFTGGTADFGKRASVTVSKSGDLIYKTYLHVTLPAVTLTGGTAPTGKWVDDVGNILISSVEMTIGGSTIDTHYGQYLSIWHELNDDVNHDVAYNRMVGDSSVLPAASINVPSVSLMVPLRFWYTADPALALPLVALQYHDVKFNFLFRPLTELLILTGAPNTPTGSIVDASLFIDYVFLTQEERTSIGRTPREYIIEQLQTVSDTASGTQWRQQLNFSHPSTAFIITAQNTANQTAKLWTDYRDPDNLDDATYGSPIKTLEIQTSGHDRVSPRDKSYFTQWCPYNSFKRAPTRGDILTYPFCLKYSPNTLETNGSINLSRIDNVSLNYTLNTPGAGNSYLITVYCLNVNLLRISSGMGGIAYAN